MAVEVIGQDESVYRQVTCKNCSAILRYVPADVNHSTAHCMGEVEVVSSVKCPKCEASVPVRSY